NPKVAGSNPAPAIPDTEPNAPPSEAAFFVPGQRPGQQRAGVVQRTPASRRKAEVRKALFAVSPARAVRCTGGFTRLAWQRQSRSSICTWASWSKSTVDATRLCRTRLGG